MSQRRARLTGPGAMGAVSRTRPAPIRTAARRANRRVPAANKRRHGSDRAVSVAKKRRARNTVRGAQGKSRIHRR
jgi:hypothetical protein